MNTKIASRPYTGAVPAIRANDEVPASPPPAQGSTADWTDDQWSTFYSELRQADAACRPDVNKHERLMVLISICIDHGINTAPHIIRVLRPMDFNNRHIGALLKGGRGRWWQEDELGAFSVIAP